MLYLGKPSWLAVCLVVLKFRLLSREAFAGIDYDLVFHLPAQAAGRLESPSLSNLTRDVYNPCRSGGESKLHMELRASDKETCIFNNTPFQEETNWDLICLDFPKSSLVRGPCELVYVCK